MKKSANRAAILTLPEVRQLTRVHRQIGALLAFNGVTLTATPRARPQPTNAPRRGAAGARTRGARKQTPSDR